MPKQNYMLQSFDDFMSSKVLFLSFMSLFLTLVIISSSLYLLFDNIGELKYSIPTVFTTMAEDILQKMETYPFLSFILEHKIMMIILHFLIYFGLGIISYYLFFAVYAFVISFFNVILIRHIQKKYYPGIELRGMGIVHTIIFYMKTIVIFLLLFLVLSPTYFIPAINILIFVPIYYFFHKTIVFDVSSEINTSKEYRKLKRVNWSELKSRTGFCFLLTLIPIVGILLYPYYILYIGHYIMKETVELRYVNDFHRIDK